MSALNGAAPENSNVGLLVSKLVLILTPRLVATSAYCIVDNRFSCRDRAHRLSTQLSGSKQLGEQAGLEPIALQEARHIAATWLDAAGVTPKVASVLMGHATPARRPGAAPITLARNTHALPDDIERARQQLDAYLAKGLRRETMRR